MDLKTFISGDATATHPGILSQIVQPIIGLIFTLAIFFFLWNVFLIVTKSDQAEEREKLKSRVVWGLVAIVVMLSVWGLVRVVLRSSGLERNPDIIIRTCQNPPC